MQQWWTLTTLAAAASDVTYFVTAWMFNSMWHEQPTGGGRGLVRRILSYGILWTVLWLVVTVVVLEDGTSGQNDDNNNHIQWWEIVGLILTALVTIWGWRDSRIHLVQGGPYHEPTITSTTLLPAEKQVMVVTGANTGIGKETVQQLAGILSSSSSSSANEHPSTILLLCRSVSKGQDAIQEIQSSILRQQHQQQGRAKQSDDKTMDSLRTMPQLRVIACDLSSYASIRTAVTEIVTQYTTIDVLINNAGVMLNDLTYTPVDGHETMLQANYLGHFLLTALLLPHFSNSSGGRIINVSSSTYAMALRDFPIQQLDDLQFLRPTNNNNDTAKSKGPSSSRSFSIFSQYAATKWCNILHTIALHDKLMTRSNNNNSPSWCIAAVHPGLVRTDVVRNMPAHLYYPNRMFALVLALLQKTPAQGAWCTVYTAVTSHLPSGMYWVNRRPQALLMMPQHNHKNNTNTSIPTERDLSEQAEKLWQWSCRQVKLSEEERKALQPHLSTQQRSRKKPPGAKSAAQE